MPSPSFPDTFWEGADTSLRVTGSTLDSSGSESRALGLMRSLHGCPETMVLAACDVDQQKLARFKNLAEEANSEKLEGGTQVVEPMRITGNCWKEKILMRW